MHLQFKMSHGKGKIVALFDMYQIIMYSKRRLHHCSSPCVGRHANMTAKPVTMIMGLLGKNAMRPPGNRLAHSNGREREPS